MAMSMSTAGMTNAARIEVANYLQSVAESLSEAEATDNGAIVEDLIKDLARTADSLRSTLMAEPTTTITNYDQSSETPGSDTEGGMTIGTTSTQE